MVKVRDGQVTNRPVYAAIGITLEGCKDILRLCAGTGGEGAKFWMSVLTDLRNRGVKDVFFVVCDGLKGLPDVVANVWPQAIVQTCIIHLIRNTFRLASKRDWDAIKRAIEPIYTAVNADAAAAALDEPDADWGQLYGAVIRLGRNDAMEARDQRLRHHLRRPVPGRRDLLTQPPETPLARETLAASGCTVAAAKR